MKKPILNVHEIPMVPRPAEFAPDGVAAENFGLSTGQLSRVMGAQKLGYNVSCLPPGKAGYPRHSHKLNEEMFFILQGTGELRVGDERFPVKPGDVIACPPGGPESAHQLRNTGTEELRYLAVSTRLGPEICEYPDSGKFGVYGEFPGPDGKPAYFYYMGRPGNALDYWEGEDGTP